MSTPWWLRLVFCIAFLGIVAFEDGGSVKARLERVFFASMLFLSGFLAGVPS